MKLLNVFKKNIFKVSSMDKDNIRKGYRDLHFKYERQNHDIVGSQKCTEKMLSLSSIKEPLEVADLYNDIGNRYTSVFSNYSLASPYYENALKLYDTLLEHSNPATYGNLAKCYFVEECYRNAFQFARNGLILIRSNTMVTPEIILKRIR